MKLRINKKYALIVGTSLILMIILSYSTNMTKRIMNLFLQDYQRREIIYHEKIKDLREENLILQNRLIEVNKKLSTKPLNSTKDQNELIKLFNDLGYSVKLADCKYKQ